MTINNEIINKGWNLDNSYANLPRTFYTSLNLNPVHSPKLIILNNPLAESLGLNIHELLSEDGLAVLAGNQVPKGSLPIAQAYAGHQFGHFTMLGDGRALLIGEQITPKGERFDIQLKGSGPTPFSRRGDGRAALGPMLREYIISEAMYALGIPTTRSLAVVSTGELIARETAQPGAILSRVAASHLRVGTFEYAARFCKIEELKDLADYTLQRHFSEIEADENRYLSLLQEVVKRQAILIAKWQLVGFIHGVMNTDNMAISGESIDYGPCAFMDIYDPLTVFSSIDVQGRYAYGNQPSIAGWNLARFAETLLPLLNENQDQAIKLAQDSISNFNVIFNNNWLSGMRAKLGIFNQEKQDESLIHDILSLMKSQSSDYTNTFRALTLGMDEETVIFGTPLYDQWKARLERQEESIDDSHNLMRRSNPSIIPRNHRVEAALEAAVKRGDYSVMDGLLNVLSSPYEYSPEQYEYCKPSEISKQPYKTYCGT